MKDQSREKKESRPVPKKDQAIRVEEGQKWDGKKFESDGARVHPGIGVARPKPAAMG